MEVCPHPLTPMPPFRRIVAVMVCPLFRRASAGRRHAAGRMILAAGLAAVPPAAAQTVFWGSEGFVRNVDSRGVDWGEGFVVSMGVFREDFEPGLKNRNEWQAHWVELDRADFDAEEGRFAGSVEAPAPQSGSAPRGVYFWARDGSDIAKGPEWLLIGNPAWTWPPQGGGLPLVWTASDAGTVVIGEIATGNIRLRSAAASPVPEDPADWWARHFEDEPDWEGDADGDGVSNLAEYALGRDPRKADGPAVPALIPGEEGLRIRLARNAYATAIAEFQVSDDLRVWLPPGEGVETLSERPDGIELIDRYPARGGRRFFRFHFKLPEK